MIGLNLLMACDRYSDPSDMVTYTPVKARPSSNCLQNPFGTAYNYVHRLHCLKIWNVHTVSYGPPA